MAGSSSQPEPPVDAVAPAALDTAAGELLSEDARGDGLLAQFDAVGLVGGAEVGGCGLVAGSELAPLGEERAEDVLVLAVLGRGLVDGAGAAEPVALPVEAALDGPGEDAG